ncbi:MAG: energy transducer TonB [Candidatus Velthaea sp.]
MSHPALRIVALVSFAASAVPLAATAQTAVYYTPPKLLTRGSNTSQVAGKGTVTVKVFVHKNGTVEPPKAVAKSTNPGDNAAALEIAATSKYKPALKDGKPVDAYYTFVLNFSTNSSAGDVGDAMSNAGLQRVAAMERGGNYAGAKTELAVILKNSPDDKEANLLLAVADAFTDDAAGASAAFDKAGTIPAKYKVLAGRAYANAGAQALKANNADAAAADAAKAIELAPSAEGYNIRGSAEFAQKKYDAAIADLEKARDLAIAAKSDGKQIAIIEANLTAAYFGAGQSEKGLAAAKDVQRLDPSITIVQDSIAQYYNDKANTLVKAGNRTDAAAQLDVGAGAAPKYAVMLYANAALVLANDTKPDWKKVKAESDKALAIDPNDARANYTAGFALANDKNTKDALTYLTKAQAAAKSGSDAELSKSIDAAIKQLNGAK